MINNPFTRMQYFYPQLEIVESAYLEPYIYDTKVKQLPGARKKRIRKKWLKSKNKKYTTTTKDFRIIRYGNKLMCNPVVAKAIIDKFSEAPND